MYVHTRSNQKLFLSFIRLYIQLINFFNVHLNLDLSIFKAIMYLYEYQLNHCMQFYYNDRLDNDLDSKLLLNVVLSLGLCYVDI